jgi:hypothetical protein
LSISARLRFRIFTRDNFACQYCGRRAPDVELHVDHREPRSRGGTNNPTNLVTACVDCNLGKSNERITVACPLPCFKCMDDGRELVVYHSYRERDYRGKYFDPSRFLEKDYCPEETDLYMAYYVCDLGHRWFASLRSDQRFTLRDIEDQIAQAGWKLRA